MGRVLSLNISERRGTEKRQVLTVTAIEGLGIEGDAHAGNWDRQISLLPIEALAKVPPAKIEEVRQGGYTENITILGIPLEALNVGSLVQVGEAKIKIFHIGKDHFKENGRAYIVSREGRFGIVIKGGKINKGDSAAIIS